MSRFNKDNIKELKEHIYNSYAHDAKIENIGYKCGDDSLKIELYNPIFKVKIELTFHSIGVALAVKGEWDGNREIILSLTVEENFSYLQTYLPNYREYNGNSLYLLFQMFSGDELHIVSKEITVEIIR